ncbi:unnamed protein product [Paramecium pentaurelia]|uniref:Uncharacterized protein n=1 Tax=Paramecium pentaurelia TaxID=43138 RepID=A0A8S1WNZ4_9CILI|nr:unnamed protein product [Paramecium pentaurelia]
MLDAGNYGFNKKIDIWKFQGQHEIINYLQQTIIEVNFFDEIGIKLFKKTIKFIRQNIQIMKQRQTSNKQSLQAGRETMIYQYGILNVKDKMQEQVDQRLQDWDMDRIINSIFQVHYSSFDYLVLAKLNTKKDRDFENGIFFLKKIHERDQNNLIMVNNIQNRAELYNDHGMREGLMEELFDNLSLIIRQFKFKNIYKD